MEQSELEQSIHLEEDGYKPSRDLKFCLGDYITDKVPGFANAARNSVLVTILPTKYPVSQMLPGVV
ncbi:unnamed protein product [Strongylus vulgaris]|uniref:Uncharacterized protein n=1 Tax=Strongylus vulgaris TaxID=40348 RepID=A0A3P7KCM8_STRVU|nr:unnamed protein product [Strongylus vulgaris]